MNRFCHAVCAVAVFAGAACAGHLAYMGLTAEKAPAFGQTINRTLFENILMLPDMFPCE